MEKTGWTAGEGNGGEKRIFFFLLALEKPLCAATVGHRSREKEATGSPAIPVPPAAPALAEQILVRDAFTQLLAAHAEKNIECLLAERELDGSLQQAGGD